MVFWYELKKLLCHPLILVWCFLAIGLNIFFVFTTYHTTPSLTGFESSNIYEEMEGADFAKHYIRKYQVTGKNAENIVKKYEDLTDVIEKKARDKEALSFYFGSQTPFVHRQLFNDFFLILLVEISLLALFIGLFSIPLETIQRTDDLIFTTRIGRGIVRPKYWSGVLCSLLLASLIVGISLGVYFFKNDFSMVWTDYVSSQFNQSVEEYGKPFMTWQSHTVASYLRNMSFLSLGLSLCFYFIGYGMTLCYRKPYRILLSTVLFISVTYFGKFLFPIGSNMRGFFGLSPIWLLRTNGLWFTDGGADIIWSHFEIKGLLLAFIGLGFSLFLIKEQWLKKEWKRI